MTDEVWDLLVVGGGTAGIVASTTAAALGARVALVERDRTGGDCLWTGCVPSKALIAAAGAVASVRRAAAMGVHVGDVLVDFGEVMQHVRRSIAAIEPDDSPSTLERQGVRVISGLARFTGSAGVEVDGRPHRFRQAVVCTGSTPAVPDLPGLQEAHPLTSDTVWELDRLPGRLVVLGGGSTGCELAQAFSRLGSHVTLVEADKRVLGEEDPDASTIVRRALEADGVQVLTGQAVTGVELSSGQRLVRVGKGAAAVECDEVLVVVGRTPGTSGLGLERAGVDLDDEGRVAVDRHLRTSNRRVWAAGDVTPHAQFTHVAGVHGALAATNAVLGTRRSVDLSAVPRVTFTDPEVATVGAPSWCDGSSRARTVTREHHDVDRAVTDARTDGFSRLVLDRRRRVVGATIVGPRAGESLAEVTAAIRARSDVGDVAATIHAYPTYGDGVWNAGIASYRARLRSPVVRVVLTVVRLLRRTAGR